MERVLFCAVKDQRKEKSFLIMFFILLVGSIAVSTVILILYRRFAVISPKSPLNDENKKIINENDDDKQLTETKIQNVDGENEKQELTSAAEQTFSLFDAVSDDFKFNIFPRNSLTIRTSDTPVQKSVYSCCYSSSTVSKTLLSEKNNNKNLSIASSLVLMRHFERIDHVDPAWFQKMTSSTSSGKNSSSSSQHCYFHRDPPLSPNGILDGLRFSAQFAARLGKKNRSIEDNFSFIVSSPSLRCLQTALLMAHQQHGVPVLIEDSVSDWVNRRVFGANVSERPQTSLQFDMKTGVWWISAEIISHFVKKQVWSQSKEKVWDGNDDDAVEEFLPPGVLHDTEKKRYGFFDFQRTLRGAKTEDVEQQSRSFFKKLPEPEREFSERVKSSIENILSPSLSFSSSSKTVSSKKQKSFSPSQMKQAFFSCAASRSTSFSHQYSLRLLVVTHADFARVAASELTPRCANTPSANDGISVLYGSLSQIVKLVVSKNDDDDDENDSSCGCYHLVSFGSRDPAAADCPIMKVK